MSAMFLAMVWHARRRQAAMREVEAVANVRASLLELHERFLHDASHELRTPVTIARGHLELLNRDIPGSPELVVALDELQRMERIIDRLLLLAKAEQPDFVVLRDVAIDRFLEDVFMRWSEVAPRVWRLELDVAGVLRADPEALRSALDALLENAVKYTESHAAITLRAHAVGGEIVIEVVDDGSGIPDDAIASIFDRFARADDARTRAHGGVGLGLAIVAAIAHAHGGRCTVERRNGQTVFALVLPVGDEIEASGGRRARARRPRDDLGRAAELVLLLARHVYGVPEMEAALDAVREVDHPGDGGDDPDHQHGIHDDCNSECHGHMVGGRPGEHLRWT